MADIDNVMDGLYRLKSDLRVMCAGITEEYYENSMKSVDNAIQTIKDLHDQIPKWHLCSEELPKEATCYLCAVKHRFDKDDRWRWTVTDIVLFGTENNWIVDENKNEVIAWMKLPNFESEE